MFLKSKYKNDIPKIEFSFSHLFVCNDENKTVRNMGVAPWPG
jgi:hypothetical protein